MKFSRAEIPDIIIIDHEIHKDDRGYFYESFRQDKLNDFLGYDVKFCQENESKSTYGVLRGLHYQESPFAQAKLVRVIQGSVLDVAVDIRKNSPTFGKHVAIELNEENKKQLFIPKGFAHGFSVLTDSADVMYKCDALYNKQSESGLIFNDPSLNIDWKLSAGEMIVSEKDLILPVFDNIDANF